MSHQHANRTEALNGEQRHRRSPLGLSSNKKGIRRIVAASLLGLAVMAVLGACSSDSDDVVTKTTAKTASESTTTTAVAAESTTVPAAKKVDVTAKDYAFEGIPSTLGVGSEFAMKNTSTKEVHEMVVMRLPDDEKRTAKELMSLTQDQLMGIFTGGPTTVIVAPPAADGFPVVGDGTIGKAGRYIAFCSIPVGANPSEYMAAASQAKGAPVSVPGGPPHFVEGMYSEFTVE